MKGVVAGAVALAPSRVQVFQPSESASLPAGASISIKVVVPPISAACDPVAWVSLAKRAHERQVDMHVRVDEAGKDVFAAGINDPCAFGGRQVLADLGDGFAFNQKSAW